MRNASYGWWVRITRNASMVWQSQNGREKGPDVRHSARWSSSSAAEHVGSHWCIASFDGAIYGGNINPQGAAGAVGRAVPLAFALATVGVLLIAYSFVRLCQRFHHAGSVYGFVGVTLGPRSGIVAG